MSLTGVFSFVGSNGLESSAFPLTVLTEKEIKIESQRELFTSAKARNSAIDGIALVAFSATNVQAKACNIALATKAFGLK